MNSFVYLVKVKIFSCY